MKRFESELRARERNIFDDDRWYRFGRNQNIDKQEFAKLGVAETVRGMTVFADPEGEYYFNNVRVNGILPASEEDLYFLLGILNSPVVDFIFKRIAKPEGGGYFEANKQYISPLPIPAATVDERVDIGAQANRLEISIHHAGIKSSSFKTA